MSHYGHITVTSGRQYDVTFTEQAENNLRGIFEYIAFDLISPENAAGQLDRIEEKILVIIINPMRRMRHLVSYVFSFYYKAEVNHDMPQFAG